MCGIGDKFVTETSSNHSMDTKTTFDQEALLTAAPAYFQPYIDYVRSGDILTTLESQIEGLCSILDSVPADKRNYAYAEGKWTIKQLIGHIIDSERVFAYRAMRFARHDATDLAGFDHDDYVVQGNFELRSIDSLKTEWRTLRGSSVSMLKNIDDAALQFTGTANKLPMSVYSLQYIMAGHVHHHLKVLREKYLAA